MIFLSNKTLTLMKFIQLETKLLKLETFLIFLSLLQLEVVLRSTQRNEVFPTDDVTTQTFVETSVDQNDFKNFGKNLGQTFASENLKIKKSNSNLEFN